MKSQKYKKNSKPKRSHSKLSPPLPHQSPPPLPKIELLINSSNLTDSLNVGSLLNQPNLFLGGEEYTQDIKEKLQDLEKLDLVSSFQLEENNQSVNNASINFEAQLYISSEESQKHKVKQNNLEDFKIEENEPYEENHKHIASGPVFDISSGNEISTDDISEFLTRSQQAGESVSEKVLGVNKPNENSESIPALESHADGQIKNPEQSINIPIISLCENCNKKSIEVEFECSHKFCIDCAENVITEVSNENLLLAELKLKELIFRCLICKNHLRKDNYWKITNSKRDELLSNADPSKWKGCDRCKSYKEISELFDNLCRECYAYDLRIRKMEILDSYDEQFINEKMQCDGCENIRYFVGDSLTSVCPLNHYHCKKCLEEIEESGKCIKCRANLLEETKIKIDKILYGNCNTCQEKIGRDLLIPKWCCEEDICVLCQILSPNSYQCSLCQRALPTYAKLFINEAKQELSQND